MILNNASICAAQPLWYEPIYNVTKAALVMLSKNLANELIQYIYGAGSFPSDENRLFLQLWLAQGPPQTLEEFWDNLKSGRDCIGEIPADRWRFSLGLPDPVVAPWGEAVARMRPWMK